MVEKELIEKLPESVIVGIDLLSPDPLNPNEEKPEVFAELVENIRQYGFVEPVMVRPDPDVSGRYRIVNGEHRWRAAKALGYRQVPVVDVGIEGEDEARIAMVRMNWARGKVNPFKFTKLFNELRKRYDPEELRRKMGITNDSAFMQIYKDVRANLPPEVQRRLDKTKKEMVDVHDLADVVKGALAKYGSTLEHSFLVLEYGGRRHYVIRLTERAFKNIERIADGCLEKEVDVNTTLVEILEGVEV